MPLTSLDPSTALIVIDLQKGMVDGHFIHPIGEIIERTRELIDVSAQQPGHIPVAFQKVLWYIPVGNQEVLPNVRKTRRSAGYFSSDGHQNP
jgi:nicotinamidase-related amidase